MKNIPWPTINTSLDEANMQPVPLSENYSFSDMLYLDSEQAMPIFETQADIIINKNCKGIVDVGCRHGPVLNILYEKGYTDFRYMGFDTSAEPIEIASKYWKDYSNIEFRQGSWNSSDIFKVNFDVDQVIWSGVLLYREIDHMDFFFEVTRDVYKSSNAIIQEPMQHQRHWNNSLKLNTIAEQLDSYASYCKSFKKTFLDLEIFAGRRVIVDVEL